MVTSFAVPREALVQEMPANKQHRSRNDQRNLQSVSGKSLAGEDETQRRPK